jgi:hypothetical protein
MDMAGEHEIFDAFKKAWPYDRLKAMTLDEYCSVGNDDSYCYWLEFKTDSLGGIGGGSAYKFGVYKKRNAKSDHSGNTYASDGVYAWVKKYGDSAQAVFATIKAGLAEAAEAASRGNIGAVEKVDLPPTLKWKTAFLYQDLGRPMVCPIYLSDAMKYLAFGEPDARRSLAEANEALIARKPADRDVFDFAAEEWARWTAFQGSVRGLIASDGHPWKDDLVKQLMGGGKAVIWWSKRPSGKALVADRLYRLIAEKGSFYFYFTRSGIVTHRARVIDVSFERDYESKRQGWAGAIGFVESFEEYTDDDNKSAVIAFLIDEMARLDGSLKPTDFTYWNDFSQPTQDNLQPFVSVRDEVDIDAPIVERAQLSPIALPAKNVIYYGPPGTGKTFFLRTRLFDRFTRVSAGKSRDRWMIEETDAMAWWKVVAAALLSSGPSNVPALSEHEFIKAKIKSTDQANPRAMIWSMLQQHTFPDCDNVKYSRRADPPLFRKEVDSVWEVDGAAVRESVPEVADFVERAGDYSDERQSYSMNFEFITFHQSISYEDFIEGIKPSLGDDSDRNLGYEIKDGIFKQICRRARLDPSGEYALFIDEINRGNVAGIFGELITLIEEDKRAGAATALTATLPYSREQFSVPPNLYIIGTMNSADRSVEALDTALRRRFSFIEMEPKPDLLDIVEGIDLPELLETVNRRIEALRDRDHRIGHAYLQGIKSLEGLKSSFADKIIPLLREYFYGDWSRIALVLGKGFVAPNAAKASWPKGLEGEGEAASSDSWTITKPEDWTEGTFRSIYE